MRFLVKFGYTTAHIQEQIDRKIKKTDENGIEEKENGIRT